MSENNTSKKSSDYIDLGKIFSACLKKWYIILGSVIFCVLLAFVYQRRNPEEYLVQANLLISQEGDAMPSSGLSALFGSSADVEDELFAVSSHTVLRNAAKRLGLNITYKERTGFLKSRLCYNDEPIELIAPAGISDTLGTTLRFIVKVNKKGKVKVKVRVRRSTIALVEDATFPVSVPTDYGTFIFKKTENYPTDPDETVAETAYLYSYDRVAEILSNDIEIDKASRKSNVIYLQMLSSNPEYAKALLNCITDEYNTRSLNEKNSRSEKTLAFLDERLAMMSDDLAQTERLISQFKSKNNIPDLVSEATYQYTLRGELDQALTKAEAESEMLSLISDFIADPRNATAPVPGAMLGESAAAAAIGKYNERVIYRQKLAENVSPDNKVLRNLDSELEARREGILASLRQTAEAADLKVRELRSKHGSNLSALGSVPQKELEYRDIERQRKIKEQLYVFLLKQREERSIMLANGQLKGQIIDEAYSSTEPEGLSAKAVYLIAAVLGFLFALLIIYLMNAFRSKFSTREELEEVTDVPVLGEVCTDRSGDALVVRAGGSNSAAELFRLIRSNLQFILRSADSKVILMTSTRSGEGKSFISINLAASLALLNKRVLLVGADVRNPKLAEYLDLPHAMGLTEYLSSDQVNLDRIIRRNPLGNGVDIITSGPIPPNPSELLSGNRIEEFIAQVRDMYDYIIIDSAPVGMVSDTFSLGRLADATIYVCRANYTTRTDVKFFNEVYDSERLPKMALVVNGTPSKKGYGYGYGSTAEAK